MKDKIAEILALCDSATPGPWIHLYPLADWEANKPGGMPRRIVTSGDMEDENWGPDILEDISEADAQFIAAARTLLPDLAHAYLEQGRELAQLRDIRDAATELRYVQSWGVGKWDASAGLKIIESATRLDNVLAKYNLSQAKEGGK